MFERGKEFVSRFLGRDVERRTAHEIYVKAAEASRQPLFYAQYDVPDTVEGRYDMLSIHIILLLRTLKTKKQETAKLAQLVFDVMFRNVDDTLREMGVGDLKVGKKVREYAEAFFGRALAYEEALAGKEPLAVALARNVYTSEDPAVAEGLAGYVTLAARSLEEQGAEAIASGRFTFPEPQAMETDAA